MRDRGAIVCPKRADDFVLPGEDVDGAVGSADEEVI